MGARGQPNVVDAPTSRPGLNDLLEHGAPPPKTPSSCGRGGIGRRGRILRCGRPRRARGVAASPLLSPSAELRLEYDHAGQTSFLLVLAASWPCPGASRPIGRAPSRRRPLSGGLWAPRRRARPAAGRDGCRRRRSASCRTPRLGPRAAGRHRPDRRAAGRGLALACDRRARPAPPRGRRSTIWARPSSAPISARWRHETQYTRLFRS